VESGDRDAFLRRLRERLARPEVHEPLRPIPPWDGVVPPIAYRLEGEDLQARFVRALEAVSGRTRVLAGSADLRRLLEEIRDAHGVRRAVLSRDPECAGVAEALADLGIVAEELRSPAQAAEADLGVTGAVGGVALTGTIAVDAARAGGRTASLLPPLHLALLPVDRIVADPGTMLRALPLQGLSSNFVLITGPSRSADIELQLTLGVHGPRELWVGLLV